MLPFTGSYRITERYGEKYRDDVLNRFPHLRLAPYYSRCIGTGWAMPTGTPVLAPAPGKVIYAGSDRHGALYVDVGLPGYDFYRLGHLIKLNVKVGQYVDWQTQIGLSGATGAATGPHLYFEVRKGGIPTNPAPVLDSRPPAPPTPSVPPPAPVPEPETSKNFIITAIVKLLEQVLELLKKI